MRAPVSVGAEQHEGATAIVSHDARVVIYMGDEKGSSYDQPSTRQPGFKEGIPPRPAVLAISKTGGGEIGS